MNKKNFEKRINRYGGGYDLNGCNCDMCRYNRQTVGWLFWIFITIIIASIIIVIFAFFDAIFGAEAMTEW